MIEDMYSLIKWCEQEALEAHNSEAFPRGGESCDYDSGVLAGREEAFNEVLEKIRSNHVNQRPHMEKFLDRIE